MKCFYDQAKDKNIANYVFYGKSSDSKLYYDLSVATPVQVTQADLQDAFKKGRVLISVTVSEVETLYAAVAVVGNKAKTVDVASETVTVTEWAALAPA